MTRSDLLEIAEREVMLRLKRDDIVVPLLLQLEELQRPTSPGSRTMYVPDTDKARALHRQLFLAIKR